MCGSRKYPYHPHGRDLPYEPTSPLHFPKSVPKIYAPFPSGISKIFAHPLEILLSLIEVNKEVVLFTRMPNFVSFMYFLLKCISLCELLMRSSHRQILCVSCNFCWILQFCKWKARSRRKHNCTFLALRQEENNSWRSIIKEIRTSSRGKTLVLPNLHIWVCAKVARRRFHW